eukprot:TRINITY_DN4474_c0_g1_i3.p1 TRINITY_DN4474_c0_g1~~TRINITY_DN4474_c0_g1_i3.p1  ORF type:complete len:134 (+),score=14.14 TRINITY_DN4474_c0_g1_i3:179-580(+)
MQLSPQDRYVLVGSNSVQTGKCTYTNLGLYSLTHNIIGGGNRTHSTNLTADDRKFVGTAAAYGVQSDKVFAYMIARDCGSDANCLSVDTKQVPSSREWALAYRTVLEPATKTGNKLSEIILPTVLKFTAKKPL